MQDTTVLDDTTARRGAGSAGGQGAAPIRAAIRPPRADRRFRRFLCLDDFEVAARRHLPRMLHGYVAGGVETEASLRANRSCFGAHALVPRMLVGTVGRSQARTLFGQTYAAPFGIAPMGLAALIAFRGDHALASAARDATIPMVLSGSALTRMEEVRQSGTDWLQAYLPGDPARIEGLLARAQAAGFSTMVVTADVPVSANRENNTRNGFTVPLEPSARLVWEGVSHPTWLVGTALRTLLRHGMPHLENMDAERGPPILSRDLVRATGARDGLDWGHMALLRRQWPGKLVIKGLLSPADVTRAVDAGADGIIVSNHGGRQLDGAVAPLRALPAMRAASGTMPVMLDGGIRRGTDLLKALALGADFVFVGRPFLFAAALGGAALVRHAANLLSAEIDRDMALLGIRSLDELGPDHLLPA